MALRTWVSDLNARFQDLDLRTWVSGPQREVSGPGSQDLDARFQDLGFRTSTRGFRTWVSGPRKLSILRSSYLFPVTFLCVHRHFSLRPVVTNRRTDGLREFIYKIGLDPTLAHSLSPSFLVLFLSFSLSFILFFLCPEHLNYCHIYFHYFYLYNYFNYFQTLCIN